MHLRTIMHQCLRCGHPAQVHTMRQTVEAYAILPYNTFLAPKADLLPLFALGTLHYMAPEVVKNPLKDHPNDFKNETRYHYNSVVDSWAVGCLAYELIIGFPPFMADTQQQVVKNINTKEVTYTK